MCARLFPFLQQNSEYTRAAQLQRTSLVGGTPICQKYSVHLNGRFFESVILIYEQAEIPQDAVIEVRITHVVKSTIAH